MQMALEALAPSAEDNYASKQSEDWSTGFWFQVQFQQQMEDYPYG
jgi:hypothetical protein